MLFLQLEESREIVTRVAADGGTGAPALDRLGYGAQRGRSEASGERDSGYGEKDGCAEEGGGNFDAGRGGADERATGVDCALGNAG